MRCNRIGDRIFFYYLDWFAKYQCEYDMIFCVQNANLWSRATSIVFAREYSCGFRDIKIGKVCIKHRRHTIISEWLNFSLRSYFLCLVIWPYCLVIIMKKVHFIFLYSQCFTSKALKNTLSFWFQFLWHKIFYISFYFKVFFGFCSFELLIFFS